MPNALFRDRREGGRLLARALEAYAERSDAIVLALPRGGVPVGYEVARALGLPMDVFIVRKLGVPHHPEYAIGAIASGGVRIVDEHALRMAGVSTEDLRRVTEAEQAELERRERQYRGTDPYPDLSDKIAILVDDGLATGSTMRAAVTALRRESAARVVVAVPVGAEDTCNALLHVADDVVCGMTPRPFHAVGLWYEDFEQTTDDEVHQLLAQARSEQGGQRDATRKFARLPFDDDELETTISILAERVTLEGTVGVPPGAIGVVLFAHGSGSSRFSSRNRYVARVLRDAGLGTLLLDLLSREEESVDELTRHHRFDIPMLAERLVVAIDWLGRHTATAELPVGLFGASTGGGAALVAAAEAPARVRAVVSRGGRPDLAADALPRVSAPTLLIVGGHDTQVIQLNEMARERMRGQVRLEIVSGATHLFEEPGTLERVAELARDWFLEHLRRQPESRRTPLRRRRSAIG